MEVFLASIATEEYESMASALIEMGATNNIDSRAVDSSSQALGPLHFPWDVSEHH
jgi:hypothetical protein